MDLEVPKYACVAYKSCPDKIYDLLTEVGQTAGSF